MNSNLGTLHDYLRDLLPVLEIYERHEPLLRNDLQAAEDIDSVRQAVDLAYLKQDAIALVDESKGGSRQRPPHRPRSAEPFSQGQ